MSVEFMIKLRDGAQMIADACNETLEKMAPPETKDYPWDPNKIKWEKAEGSKGPYEKAAMESTPDFHAMLKDLKDHDGKMTKDGFFYWVFDDAATVGRKKSRTFT